MTRPPGPRGPIGVLLDAAKVQSKQTWRDVERGSGIPVPTIQAWINGSSAEPPLRAFLHLALYLNIEPEKLIEAALDGYTPPLLRSDVERPEPADATAVDRVGEVLAVREERLGERRRRSQARRRGRGQV